MNETQKAFYKASLKKQFGDAGGMFFVDKADLAEKGWGISECAFQIVWEDGPFDWAVQVFTNPKGFWGEAYNGFVLSVYEDEVEYSPIEEEPAKDLSLDAAAALAQAAWDTAIAAAPDEGTCTGGKGLVLVGTMNYRTTVQRTVVKAHCQGNVTAYKTAYIPMKIMADAGFPTEYYDGWMD